MLLKFFQKQTTKIVAYKPLLINRCLKTIMRYVTVWFDNFSSIPQSLFATSYFRHLFEQPRFQCLQLGCLSVQDDLLSKFQRLWLLCLIWRILEPRWVCWCVLQLEGHDDFLWLTKKKRGNNKVSLLGVDALWVYSGRLGVIVVDLCYFALSEDFSL